MIRILFVDDEPNVLNGLQRSMRTMRSEWEMAFVTSGHEALERLSKEEFDVVISDMKMPEMNGADLLAEISKSYPQVIRIILSGYADQELITKSVGIAHQYLAKPSEAPVLRMAVERATAVRNLLNNDKLRQIVSKMRTVPSLPSIYQELVGELENPEPSIKRISEIVRKDIGMTAKILQIINSAFFGLKRNISDPGEAVQFLGIDTVTSLTLAVGLFTQFQGKFPGSLLKDLWNHSSEVARIASMIAKREKPEIASDAFTAGLLHDIGVIILAINAPDDYMESRRLMEEEGLTEIEAERQVFDATHAEIGAYLLGLWGLPTEVVEAVAFHDQPAMFSTPEFSATTAVHIAIGFEKNKDKAIEEFPEDAFDADYLAVLGCTPKLAGFHQTYSDSLSQV